MYTKHCCISCLQPLPINDFYMCHECHWLNKENKGDCGNCYVCTECAIIIHKAVTHNGADVPITENCPPVSRPKYWKPYK